MRKSILVLMAVFIALPSSAQQLPFYALDENGHSHASCEMPVLSDETIILTSKYVEEIRPEEGNFRVGNFGFNVEIPDSAMFTSLLAYIERYARGNSRLSVSLTIGTVVISHEDVYVLNGKLKFRGVAGPMDVYDFVYELVEGTKGELTLITDENYCMWRTLTNHFKDKSTLVFRFVSGT
jgi:hypothetical protein